MLESGLAILRVDLIVRERGRNDPGKIERSSKSNRRSRRRIRSEDQRRSSRSSEIEINEFERDRGDQSDLIDPDGDPGKGSDSK